MKSNTVLIAVLWFIIGGLVGAGVTYEYAKCRTSGVNIRLDSNSKNGPGISVTRTGDEQ